MMGSMINSVVRALAAQLESDMYNESKRPENGLMTLLVKLGIQSACIDKKIVAIQGLQETLDKIRKFRYDK